MVGLDGVSCRLDDVRELLQAAAAKAVHGRALERTLLAKVGKVAHQVESGRAPGRRGARALRHADRGLRALIAMIRSAAHRGTMDPGLAGTVVGRVADAKAVLDPLLTPP